MCSVESDVPDDDDDSEDDFQKRTPPRRKADKGDDRKPVKLDENGRPYGRMMPVLEEDIKRFAKDLDPTTSWEAQPPKQKKRFWTRVNHGMPLT